MTRNLHRLFVRSSAIALSIVGFSTTAVAHFQVLYTPEMAPSRANSTRFTMVFTHPVHGGPHMDMGQPEQFYVVSQRGSDSEPKRTDLMKHIKPIDWLSNTKADAGEAQTPIKAFNASLPRSVTRSLGDHIFVLQPAPYYESSEDKYIQQFTRTMVNVGGVPGNWAEPMDLPAEIQPLNKPYANWTGGVFRGRVLADGKPVPNAEMEIEFINHALDQDGRRFGEAGKVKLPQDAYGTQTIYADAQGEFAIGLPRAGWWGICALAIGATTEHEGKALSQDAVLWVQVKDMK